MVFLASPLLTAFCFATARKHVTVEMKDDVAVVRMNTPGSKVIIIQSIGILLCGVCLCACIVACCVVRLDEKDC